jgi:ATP-dependent helicase/nuclease subunit B
MALSLIVGPPNSGRAGEVVARLREAAAHEPVLVVPTGQDAARFERDLCSGESAALGVSLRTFGWLFQDLAEAYGVSVGLPLSTPERLALVRVAVRSTPLRALARSASRPGFAPALDSLIAELGGAMVTPDALGAEAALLEDGATEAELASLYGAYAALRDRTFRSDQATLADLVLAAVRSDPSIWGPRPVFVYGFDDLTVAQRALLAELARVCDVTVAVNYSDREALSARAGMLAELREEIGVTEATELAPAAAHSASDALVHLDRNLFEAEVELVEPDGGIVLMESAGERGEADAIAVEAARLIAEGAKPDDILITTRHPAADGPLLAAVLEANGLPAALEASIPLEQTGTGRALLSLCRAVSPSGTPDDLLAHLRSDPTSAPGAVDWLERRIRRLECDTVDELISGWEKPPRHLARLREANTPSARLLTLASIARDVAEGAHRGAAPLAGSASGEDLKGPVVPLELRAAAAAAELLAELASIGGLEGVDPPDLADAVAAIEGAGVPAWRGPAEGRIRIVSPYRVRGARARYLFCAALQDGSFPARGSIDPLLGPERRSALGIAALRRRDPAEEERFLFHACVSRPRDRLYLSWRSSDENGAALARSPFVDEVLDLVAPDADAAEKVLKRTRGPEHVVPTLNEATTDRARRRALAVRESRPAAKPGPLRHPLVLAELAERDAVSANSVEGWLGCSYRWFVDHELRPVRLEPTADPLWLGSLVHKALERLYRDPRGDDTIPRPGDVGRWKSRLNELVDELSAETARGTERRAAISRVRVQLEAFLEDEAACETDLRPRPDMLEWSFGLDDDELDPLTTGELRLHGVVDRVDVAPDGVSAVVRDYKTSRKVYGASAFEKQGLLQLPLYMRAVREIAELEPIAGLYHPLAAYGDRRPRGIALKDDERLAGLRLVKGRDTREPEDFEEEIEAAVGRAVGAARRMQGGDIRRDPIGGSCPKYCTYQPICRLERALGLESEDSEDDG